METIRTKYEQVADEIRSGIKSGLYPNGKLPREIDLASRAGVSRGTIGMAMKLLAEKGLIARTRRKGTYVAGGDMEMTISRQVGVIMNSEGHFYSTLYRSIVNCLEDKDLYPVHVNYQPRIGFDAAASEKRIRKLLQAPLRGVLIEGRSYWRRPFLEKCPYAGAVFINSYDGRGEIPGRAVLADNAQAGFLAAKHLIALGHKRILFFTYLHQHVSPEDKSYWRNNAGYQREEGYRRAMKTMNPGGMAEIIQLPIDEKTKIDTIRGVLARPKRPTAVICIMDVYAVGVMITALSMGIRVPEDLAIVGMYNTPWCVESPVPLTSISFEEQEMARQAVDVVLSKKTDHKIIKVKPKLIVRASCGS